MSKSLNAIVIICVVAASFGAGAWWSRDGQKQPAAADRRVLYYHDPMHPAYKSDKPGIAPDCGMQLEPVYENGGPAAGVMQDSRPAGTVEIDEEKQRMIGVRVEPVKKAGVAQTVRIPGRVVPEESRVYKVTAAVDGVIRNVGGLTSGSMVRKDDLLATYFSRESTLREQQLFMNANQQRADAVGPLGLSVDLARDALQLLGMSEAQIGELQRSRHYTTDVKITAPADGLILARNLYLGQRFDKGTEFCRIADLRSVWVLADVYENEARLLAPARNAAVRYLDRRFPARISRTLPEFDPATRTLKLRLDVDNPRYILRPDMFVDVEFETRLPAAITVPAEAVLDSGLHKHVFVENGNGFFEPRPIETGARLGDRVTVASGLKEGERIVVSGNFLVDSESRFKLAAAPVADGRNAKDPVCGMEVDPKTARCVLVHQNKMYYFCSDSCRAKFKQNPARYVPRTGGKA